MADPSPSTQGDDHAFAAIGPLTSSLQQEWIQEQDRMRLQVILKDDFPWSFPSPGSMVAAGSSSATVSTLRYIGGVDVSFSKEDPSVACAALVVVDLHQQLEVVYEDYSAPVHLDVPYIPGFLAFREAPLLLGLLEAMKRDCHPHPYYPQLLMVDGNGLLHPRGFGLACQLGVLADIPTIGIGKNLHHVDGLTQVGVRKLLEDKANYSKDFIILIGNSGKTLGAAMKSGSCSSKPVFVSIGHRISLDSCIKVLRLCCKYRTPEPIRQEHLMAMEIKWRNMMVQLAI